MFWYTWGRRKIIFILASNVKFKNEKKINQPSTGLVVVEGIIKGFDDFLEVLIFFDGFVVLMLVVVGPLFLARAPMDERIQGWT